jgi:high-affinity iron transporter
MTGILAPTFVWFREGLEAYLIVAMAWIMVANTRQKLTIASSTFLALVGAGILGYFAQHYIANDFEAVEGWTALAASGLLFWTAWFCHGAVQHTKTIQDNLRNNGPILALAIIVFLTVFREGAEIVAFLTALWVAGTSITNIGIGAIIGLGALLIVGISASKQIKKIPVAQIFKTSRWIFTILAIYFLYYGIHELLE